MQVSLGLAFLAGLLSFVSPCVLALVPVYLAFLGESAVGRGRLLVQALLFVAGFSIVFVVVGTSFGLLGNALFRVQGARETAGLLVIGLGLLTTGVFGPVMDRFMRLGVRSELLPAARSAHAVALGALVAIGWTPCIGPVLGAILTMGASSQDALVAALLLMAYSAGLAVPFVAAALALPRLRPVTNFLRRHAGGVQVVSGLFIMTIGVLILINAFARMAGLFTFFF